MFNLEPIVALSRNAGPRSLPWLELLHRGRTVHGHQYATPAEWRDWYARMLARLRVARQGYPGARISINISTRQLLDNHVFNSMTALVSADPMVSIEWTEELVSPEDRHLLTTAAQRLLALRQGGVTVGLDDAGAGEDALRRLSCLGVPPDFIKMDGDLVRAANQNPFVRTMIETHIRGYRREGIVVVMERIETQEDVEVASEVGADFGQGYHFCGISTQQGRQSA